MIAKIVVGIVVSFLVGVGCRFFDVPSPSPPSLIGALLVVSMSLGYMSTDAVLHNRAVNRGQTPVSATTQDMCGGPDGKTREGTG